MPFETATIENSDMTYLIDFATNTIKGIGGGIEALKQKVYLEMQTERFMYPIFSNDFGFQSKDIISKDRDYMEAMFEKRAKECLIDNRIIGLRDFTFDHAKNENKEMSVEFAIDNVFNTIKYEVEI